MFQSAQQMSMSMTCRLSKLKELRVSVDALKRAMAMVAGRRFSMTETQPGGD